MKTHVQPRFGRFALAALAGVCLAVGSAWAAPIGDNPKAESPAEKIKKALDTVINAELDQTTFGAALDHIRDKTKINIVVDKQAFLNQGIQVDDSQVNLKLKEVKAKTIIKLLIAQLPQIQDFDPLTGQARQGGMTFVIDDDILYITFEHRAMKRQLSQKVNVDVEKAALDTVLKQLSKDTGVNIVLDPRHAAKVKDTITLNLSQVPVDTAVRLVSEMAGMRSVKLANVLFVTSKETAAEMKKEEEGPTPQHMMQWWRDQGFPVPGGRGFQFGNLGCGVGEMPLIRPVPPIAVPDKQ